MKSRWLRVVKNHCKASKIHRSGNMRPGHGKGKVRKTDESVINSKFNKQVLTKNLKNVRNRDVSGVFCIQGFAGCYRVSRCFTEDHFFMQYPLYGVERK